MALHYSWQLPGPSTSPCTRLHHTAPIAMATRAFHGGGAAGTRASSSVGFLCCPRGPGLSWPCEQRAPQTILGGRETPDEERRRTVLFGNGKAHPLNGDARRIRVGLPGLRWARSVRNPGWTPLANGCDKQSFPLRAAAAVSRSDSVRCTPGAWRSNPCVEVAAPFPPRADSKGVSV